MLTELTTVKARLGIVDGSQDDLLTRAIEAVSARFDRKGSVSEIVIFPGGQYTVFSRRGLSRWLMDSTSLSAACDQFFRRTNLPGQTAIT